MILFCLFYLCDQRSVIGTTAAETLLESGPMLLPVLFLLCKQLGVEHGGIAQVSIVLATEDSPGQLGLVDHGSDNVFGRVDGLVKVPSSELWRERMLLTALGSESDHALLGLFLGLVGHGVDVVVDMGELKEVLNAVVGQCRRLGVVGRKPDSEG